MPAKLNSKYTSGGGILLLVPSLAHVLLRDIPMCDHTKFQPNDTQTDDGSHCAIHGQSANPENAQRGGTILPITNLMTDSQSGNPDSHSSFLLTIRLSC